MKQGASPASPTSHRAATSVPRAVAAALLLLGTALTVGSLWLPWRHFRVPPGTSFVSPEDLAPYVPITDGLGHSFMVFTMLALATGFAAWIVASGRKRQISDVLALGCVLCAIAGALFAINGVDGAEIWRSSEATDIGLVVALAGYASVAMSSAILLVRSIKAPHRAAG